MRTWAEIDLGAVHRNAVTMCARRPAHALIAVIKADAYGHGAVPVAQTLSEAGASMLGVGDSREARELIEAGVDCPVLILGAIIDGEMAMVVRHDIRSTIHSMGRVELLEAEAARQGRVHRVHLKVDTGMGRLGMLPERALSVARRIGASPHLELEGLSTHLANRRHDEAVTTPRALETFARVHAEITAALGPIPFVHALNTAAAWNRQVRDPVGNAMRVGAALLGVPGPGAEPGVFGGAMTLKTQVIFMKDIAPGTPVGYGGTWVADRPTRLAVLPLGYNDGVPVSCGRRSSVQIRGRAAPLRGAVSMDYTTVDVTDVPGAAIGDEVVVFRGQGESASISVLGESVSAAAPGESVSAATLGESVSAATLGEFAESAENSSYVVVCGIGKRVHRIYHSDSGEDPASPASLEGEAGFP